MREYIKFCWKTNIIWKKKDSIGGFVSKIHLICLWKHLMEWKKIKPQNNRKCTQKKYIFLLKMYHHNVLSPKMERPKVLLVTIFYYLDNIFVSQISHFVICSYLDKSCIIMYYLFEPSYELQLPLWYMHKCD
jgi:hypothetical protein